MKENIIYLGLACFAAIACDPVGWDYPLNRPRSQVLAPANPTRFKKDSSALSPSIPPDTILYLCGVRMPGEYDWQRDTGIGNARGEIVLFRNMEEVLAFPTGYNECASTDADTHHLLNGNLFTEFSSLSGTVIKKNGETVLAFNGREFLVGLIEMSEGLYTLGVDRSGKGFRLRRDGAVLFESAEGVVMGSFTDPFYPRTGALYEDSGDILFAYNADTGSNRYSHLVRNGRDSTVSGISFDDMRVLKGRLLGVRRSADTGIHYFNGSSTSLVGTAYEWDGCSLFISGGKAFVAGNVRNRYGTGGSFAVIDPDSESVATYPPGDYHLYEDGDGIGLAPATYPGYHYFSRWCMDFLDGHMYVALSSRSQYGKPLLRIDGKDTELDMTGYLTGIQLCLSPPS